MLHICQKYKFTRAFLIISAIFNLFACDKGTTQKTEKVSCPISRTAFSENETELAQKNLEAKGIPLTIDSFIEAIESQDQVSVFEMIQAGISLDDSNSNGVNPLTAALSESNKDIIIMLIKNGANVNIPDKNGTTPFVKAFSANVDKTIIPLMLDYCANVNVTSSIFPPGVAASELVDTPLLSALELKDIALMKTLINKGADVNRKAGLSNMPLLSHASLQGLEYVTLLIENNADVNLRSEGNWTALIVAMVNKRYEVARYLIEQGADVNVSTKEGYTALYLARQASNQVMEALLISKGAK